MQHPLHEMSKAFKRNDPLAGVWKYLGDKVKWLFQKKN